MGRSKFRRSQDRGEIKRDKINKELGLPDNRTGKIQSVGASYSYGSASPYTISSAPRTTAALDTRRSAIGAVPVTLRGPLDGLYSQVPCVLVDDWRRRITPADLVAWRQNLTERFGDLNAATRTARRTVLNSSFWAEQIRSVA